MGGKDGGSEGRRGGATGEAGRMLAVCPAIVVLPNPLLDLELLEQLRQLWEVSGC